MVLYAGNWVSCLGHHDEFMCITDLDCMELMRKSLEKRRVREGFYFPERRAGSEKQKDLVI